MTPKIATCCFCGARTVLALDRARHELACASCGAPLHAMKSLRAGHEEAGRRVLVPAGPAHPAPLEVAEKARSPKGREAKRKRPKAGRLQRKLVKKAFKLVEDIFD